MAKILDLVLDCLYPRKCALCGYLGPESICSICFSDFRRLEPVLHVPEGHLDFRTSVFAYNGRAAQAVQRLKYSRVTSLANQMASHVFEAASELGLHSADFIVPVPIHWRRRCMRGFNQSELLSAMFPIAKFRPDVLDRVRATKPQVGLSSDQRTRNIEGAFRANPVVSGKSVLLIDDVLTSGQTANECAKALKTAGAYEVGILTFAGADYTH